MSLLLPILLFPLALPPQQAQAATVPLEDPPGPFGVELTLATGEMVLEYAWDGHAAVPYLAPEGHVFVPFGERGRIPNARLYLAGNSTSEAGLTGAVLLQQSLVGSSEGRFGAGLEFASNSRLRVALPPQDPNALGWTLSFWVRPASAAFGRRVVLLPGVLEVFLQGDGRAVAHLLPSGEQIVHPRVLAAGRWEHLVVGYDPAFTGQMRFLVGDQATNVSFATPALARVASELVAGDVTPNGQGFVGTLDDLMLEALPLSTAQGRLSAQRPLDLGPHALRVVTNRGLRNLSPVAAPTREMFLDTPEELALGQLDGVALENGVLRWVPGRWRVLDTSGSPPPRTTHPTVSLGGGRVWVFDGETRDSHLGPPTNTNDTWILDRDGERWERVNSPVAPSKRCHVPAAYSPDHDLVLLQGGWKNDTLPTTSYGDTWVYLVTQRRWEQRFPAGGHPPIGSDFGLVYLPTLQRFQLFTALTSLLYDPIADTWEVRPPPSAIDEAGQPTSFEIAASAMWGFDPISGLVVFFGGHTGPSSTIFHDTTALYDPVANRFTVLAPAQHPSPRARAAFGYDSQLKRFVLFGGVRDQFAPRSDDLWSFDPAARSWTELGCSNRPSARGGYFGMAYDELAHEFVVVDGRHDAETWLDETQVLQVRPNEPGRAVFTFDRLQDWNKTSFTADVTTPGSSSVTFLFRWSGNGNTWTSWRQSTGRLGRTRYLQVAALLQPGAAGEVPELRRLGLR